MTVITMTTIIGNVVVIVAVKRARRAPSHYPLASLAAADLLIGLFVLPIAVGRDLFIFHLPWPICACWSTLDVLCCTASIFSICALGWERWCGITNPLARSKRARRAKLSAAMIWPLSTIIALPTAFIPSQKHYIAGELGKACTVNTNVGYVFTSNAFSFYIPASIMVYLYARILHALATPPSIRSHRGAGAARTVNNMPSKPSKCDTPTRKEKPAPPRKITMILTPKRGHLDLPGGSIGTPTCTVPSPLKSSKSPGGIIPRQRRATRTIVMLMSLFLICWLPFFVMLPADSICECVLDTAWLWCTWLGYANSSLNPLVYAAGSPSVRRALRNSFTTTTMSSARVSTDVPLTPSVRRS